MLLEDDSVPCLLEDDQAEALLQEGVIHRCHLHGGLVHYHISDDSDWSDVGRILKIHDDHRVLH